MSFTSYTNFVTVVENYLARTDLSSQIPDFIQLAQTRMSRDLRTEKMLSVTTLPITGGSGTVAMPSDLLEVREIHIQGNPVVRVAYQSPDLFFKDGLTTTSGIPTFFTMLGSNFEFAPIPNGSQTVQILYYAQPTFISTTTASNIYLVNYPDALLYATLAEAEPYLMNDARIQTWSALYDRAIQNIKTSDLGATYPYTSINVTPR
jgi:hypothetical protein